MLCVRREAKQLWPARERWELSEGYPIPFFDPQSDLRVHAPLPSCQYIPFPPPQLKKPAFYGSLLGLRRQGVGFMTSTATSVGATPGGFRDQEVESTSDLPQWSPWHPTQAWLASMKEPRIPVVNKPLRTCLVCYPQDLGSHPEPYKQMVKGVAGNRPTLLDW